MAVLKQNLKKFLTSDKNDKICSGGGCHSSYSIDRGVYDNPKDAQYRAMEIFVNEGIEENNIKIREVPL